ncbi:MAG: hypothetical protein ACON3Z_15340 [Bradymonadia bacterium]
MRYGQVQIRRFRMVHALSALFAFTLIMPLPSQAKKGNKITRVIPESREKTIEYTFIASGEIDGSKAEALPADKGRVLILRLGGVAAKRKWIKHKDKDIKRVLLHGSSERPPGAVLRVRFKKKVINRDFMRRIRVHIEDSGIRISIPRPGVPADLDSKQANQPKSEPSPNPTASQDNQTAQTTQGPPAMESAGPPATNASAGNEETFDIPKDSAVQTAPRGLPGLSPPQDLKPVQGAEMDVADGETGKQDTPTAPKKATPVVSNEKLPPTPAFRNANTSANQTDTAAKTDVPAAIESNPNDPTPIMPDAKTGSAEMIFMPGVRTRDVLAGFTDLSLRLEKSMVERRPPHRIAVFPFLALDKRAMAAHVDTVSQAVMTNRILKRPGFVQTDPDLLTRTVAPLKRDEMGRFDLDEARAAGVAVGADTLIVGTVSSAGNGFTVDTRAIDIESGKRLGEVSQEFDQDAFEAYANAIRDERSYEGTLWRSAALPGWGQLYQKEKKRGAVYMTIFATTMVAGLGSSLAAALAEQEYRQSTSAADVGLRETANSRYAQANAFFVTAGVVWLAAMADSVFGASKSVSIDPERYGAPR